ncbi:MAG: transglutaminase-like domain-containing protein [Mycobacterium leprae]
MSTVLVSLIAALFLLPFAALASYALPASLRLCGPKVRTLEGVTTLHDAVAQLRGSELSGWELVQAAQRLVAAKMAYSRRNSWDTPRRAFARGMGYCHQRALALNAILHDLGIPARPVFARQCRFPAARIHEYIEPERVAGHVWLRVRVDGVEKDVCPGDKGNTPGTVHFAVLSPMCEYRGLARLGGQLGSIFVNTQTDNRAVRRLRHETPNSGGRGGRRFR